MADYFQWALITVLAGNSLVLWLRLRRLEYDHEAFEISVFVEGLIKWSFEKSWNKDIRIKMDKCVEHLSELFRGIHVGRADPDLLSSVRVQVDQEWFLLPQVALVSLVNPQLLKAQPYDRDWLFALEKSYQHCQAGCDNQHGRPWHSC